jgi:coproporphyrinogen III oxidase-like Fe-S oxidoreductase
MRALAAGLAPPRELEPLDRGTRQRERLMLGLRLDEPVPLDEVASALDEAALARLNGLRLAETTDGALRLTERGRFLGGAVTAELMAEMPAKTTIEA